VLAALKTATDHLVLGGTFCTKVYRSVDYNSVMWVLQQLFEDVQTMKPNSSRSQSSEIFVVCLKYTKPNFIDPKLLDPNHVFKEVADPGLAKVNVLHKKYEKSNLRHRSGYDESLGMILHSQRTITEFFETKEPIRMLTDVNAIVFSDAPSCQAIKNHRRTTEEIMTCLSDLRLLGKLDFKKILKWRTQIRKETDSALRASKGGASAEGDDDEEDLPARLEPSQLSEDAILEEIEELREKASQLDRKDKKKARKLTAKDRQRQFLGMSSEGFDVGEDMELFALNDGTTKAQLDTMRDVQLEDLDEFPRAGEDYEWDEDMPRAAPIKGKARRAHDVIEVTEDQLEDELEMAYKRFQAGRSARHAVESKGAKKTHYTDDGAEVDSDGDNITPSAKRARAKLTSEAQLASLEEEDAMLMQQAAKSAKKQRKNAIDSEDMEAYVNMLTKSTKKTPKGKNGEAEAVVSADSDSDDSDDGFSDREEPIKARRGGDGSDDGEGSDAEDDYLGEGYVHSKPGQVVSRDGLSSAGKAAKWFANPIFSSSLVSAEDAAAPASSRKNAKEPAQEKTDRKAGGKKRSAAEVEEDGPVGYAAMADLMPKTDKQARKEQRKKDTDRRERRAQKSTKTLEDDDGTRSFCGLCMYALCALGTFEGFVARSSINVACCICFGSLAEPQDAAKDLIKRGVGKNGIVTKVSTDSGFEIVPAENEDATMLAAQLQRVDQRTFDSDSEEYDAHDRTRTLALGTMMLRNSKKKALVDASYNRFAWNDPRNLPSWFVDDEMRHNKPQLPIPNALLEQVRVP
jgi:hypothetical protein